MCIWWLHKPLTIKPVISDELQTVITHTSDKGSSYTIKKGTINNRGYVPYNPPPSLSQQSSPISLSSKSSLPVVSLK